MATPNCFIKIFLHITIDGSAAEFQENHDARQVPGAASTVQYNVLCWKNTRNKTSNNVDDMQYKWIYPYCSCLAMSCYDSVLISFIQQNYFQNNHILPIYVCTFGIFRCMVICMLCCPKISIRICAHYWSFVTKGIMYSHASICNIYTYILFRVQLCSLSCIETYALFHCMNFDWRH